MDLQPIPEGNLRTGFTTGACATACTKAALLLLLTGKSHNEVEILLPAGQTAIFKIKESSIKAGVALCTTIKDAGDDPDITHGAEIGCKVRLNKLSTVRFLKGEGVGVITLPGLSLPVGEPAINPVPRSMMTSVVEELRSRYNIAKGADIEVFVKNGEELAKKTLNSRVGIIGGLSILGTTGIVRPFSAEAYISSITQGIDVAVANGCSELVINSGGRSEKILKLKFPLLPEVAFIQYGNWIGETLEKIETTSLSKIHLGMMLGKAVKLAKGDVNTHSTISTFDKDFLIEIARIAGYGQEKSENIAELSMARRLSEIFPFHAQEPFYQVLIQKCLDECRKIISKAELDFLLIGENGEVVQQIK